MLVRLLCCFIAVQLYCVQIACAQHDRIKLTLFVNSTYPTGDLGRKIGDLPRITRRFGFDYGQKVGLANAGFGAGIESGQQVILDNLHWVMSAKLLANSVDNSEITTFFRHELGDSVSLSFENGTWLNIPILTGFSYGYGLLPGIRVYGILQAGLNFTRQPYRKAIISGQVVEETTFRLTPDFGFEAGFGFEFNSGFNIGFRYLNLSNPRYEGTRILKESFFTSIPKRVMNVDGDERPISMIIMFVGYGL